MIASWFWWALLSALFAALTAIFAKVGLARVDADAATWVRSCVILACVTALMASAGKWSALQQFTSRTWVFLVLSGLVAAASWLCYFRALQLGTASQVAMVDRSSAVLVVLLAVGFLAERPSPREWLGIGLAIAGVMILGLGR